MGHQDRGLEDSVILLRLPQCEEGTAGRQDLLNLLIAGEITHNGLIDGGGSLNRQGVHEHGRSGGHGEGLMAGSLFVNSRLVRSCFEYALSFRLAAGIRPLQTKQTPSDAKTYHE